MKQKKMVLLATGLEPARYKVSEDLKSTAFTNSATLAALAFHAGNRTRIN